MAKDKPNIGRKQRESVNPEPTCKIRKNSGLGEVMQAAKLIVWDEVTMAHKGGIEALDRSLRDIRDCERVFGGLTVLIIGDFQQILPVVKKDPGR